MQELTAKQAVLLLNSYLGALKNESRITKNILAAVPTERAEYRPDPASKSAMTFGWESDVSARAFSLTALSMATVERDPAARTGHSGGLYPRVRRSGRAGTRDAAGAAEPVNGRR